MDTNEFIQRVQDDFLTPLTQLPVMQLQLMDIGHDQAVSDFQNAVAQLCAPQGPEFNGKGANAFFDLVSQYLGAESGFSDYTNEGVSDLITQVISTTSSSSTPVEKDMSTMVTTMNQSAVDAPTRPPSTSPESPTTPTEPPVGDPGPVIVIIVAVGLLIWLVATEAPLEANIMDIDGYVNQWVNEMKTLAGQPETKLPADPSTIAPSVQADLPAIAQATTASQEEELARQLSQEPEFRDLTLEEILAVIQNNPGGANINFYRDRLRQYRSLRNALRRKYPTIPADIITQIILKNPGLSRNEYDLLAQYYVQHQTVPFNVIAVTRAFDGSIVFLTKAALDHIREAHPDQFGNLDDAALIDLIMKTVRQNPSGYQDDGWIYGKAPGRRLKVVVNKDGMIVTFYYLSPGTP